ncbi:Glycosyl transferase, WecB/TagA/CpsF family protein [Sulfitobacter noctilucae]|uniref:WecB/TagA/CpsF family glycosyltransferase n=1 Tax=Sulfitobacter noctilucae TaxID=1342302 RepID=UPI000469D164|nr:WecB/TagA/CpsF family glycosyltransferase [Sulfitobacter noctilucae]KIN61605.1 Glycosyl transferase, WecB/TagA/CpsF family protein [Sulfitobacter noctilucae]
MNFGATTHAVEVNVPTKEALFQSLRSRLAVRQGFALATLNLDHLTKLPTDSAFLAAYRAHDFVVADGRPVVWLSHLAGKPLELMPGSDLILPLCALCAELGVSIALVGSSDAALEGASDALKTRVPGLTVSYLRAPPYGFDPTGTLADEIFAELEASRAGLCFIALGAPKQEIFAAKARLKAPSVGFASIGAGLDFLSGDQQRAPLWMRKLALEWLWRALQQPRRMAPRYAKCFAILPGLALQAWKQRS